MEKHIDVNISERSLERIHSNETAILEPNGIEKTLFISKNPADPSVYDEVIPVKITERAINRLDKEKMHA